jgi:formylglycine-generating enzyme required for sulfatase activity
VIVGVAAFVVLVGGSVGAWYAYKQFSKPAEVTGPTVPALPAPAPAPDPAPPPPATPVPPEGMVYVPAATLMLGSDEPGADIFSTPAHPVPVKAFFVDKTEVTNAQYKRFVDATGHAAPAKGWVDGAPAPGTENKPVVNVAYQDAADFAAWAGKRLPTEAEWELAARGTDGRAYPWGREWDRTKGNFSGKGGKIADVGSAPGGASPFGALDMLGNVWEWTSSEYSLYPGTKAQDEPKSKGSLVIRGGGYEANETVDSTYRGFWKRGDPGPQLGFRCVKDAP